MLLLHNIFMGLAWGFFSVFGAFIARYRKTIGPNWHNLHMGVMAVGVLGCTIAGYICIEVYFAQEGEEDAGLHGIMGVIVLAGLAVQAVSGFFGDVIKKMGQKVEKWWCLIHVWVGRGTVLLGLVTVYLGLRLLGVGDMLMGLYWTWIVFIVLTFGIAEWRSRMRVVVEKPVQQDVKVQV